MYVTYYRDEKNIPLFVNRAFRLYDELNRSVGSFLYQGRTTSLVIAGGSLASLLVGREINDIDVYIPVLASFGASMRYYDHVTSNLAQQKINTSALVHKGINNIGNKSAMVLADTYKWNVIEFLLLKEMLARRISLILLISLLFNVLSTLNIFVGIPISSAIILIKEFVSLISVKTRILLCSVLLSMPRRDIHQKEKT